jgi:hypothetical protein
MKRITHIKMVQVLLPVAFASALLAALMLAFAPGQFASAQGSTTLGITSLTISGVGYTGTNEIQVTDVFSLFYGVEFTLEYDENVVRPVDADPYTPGGHIGVGPVFTDQAPDYFVARNWVYSDTGSVAFRASLRDPAPPFTGTGTVANVTWECLSEDSSPLTFTMSKLADYPDGHVIPHTVTHGTIECDDPTPTPTPTSTHPVDLQGTILLQGRSDHSDTYVFATIDPCSHTVSVASMDIPIPNLPSDVTDASGYFGIDLYPDHTGREDYKCLQAFHHGYLVGQATLPQPQPLTPPPLDLGTITLLGGDPTEDDCIDIFDLALIAARYGGSDATADINGDGVVDIYDLVIAAGNYDTCGPQTNWH